MITYIVRFMKRFAVLLPGIIIAYFSVRDIFPVFNKRLPASLAIFFTYVIAAYVLIPALIRIIRIIAPARHVPLYCVTPDGFASDPINIAVVGSKKQLTKAMEAAGWHIADRLSPHNVFRQLASAILKRPYPTAPMSRLYLFGRKQDLGFEVQIKGSRGHRHHVRFWATTYDDEMLLSFHTIHWYKRRQALQGKNLLWVGAASRDVGFAFIRHNAQITHMIDPDTNAERELIATGLLKTGRVASEQSVRLGKPYRLVNRVWRGYLHSDGVMHVLKLKS
jgi:hypothetical protein